MPRSAVVLCACAAALALPSVAGAAVLVATPGIPRAAVAANSEVRASTFGVLELTLSESSYAWRFRPESDATFTDSGTNTCH